MAPQTLNEILLKYENSGHNKTRNDILLQSINMYEKKKVPYVILTSPLYTDDKKSSKRAKKPISNNKYILFNSWYHKIKEDHYPSSSQMWNLMKNKSTEFINLFDFVEKVGKTIEVHSENDNEADSTPGRKLNETEVLNSNTKRMQLYNEFYKLLNITLDNDSAPATHQFYTQTIKGERLTPTKVQTAIYIFKNVLNDNFKDTTQKSSSNATPTAISSHQPQSSTLKRKKEKDIATVKIKKNKKEFVMVNDYADESQLMSD
ncbi:39 kDa protein [Adoxophyes orana nucleopolyhedrovirus]|uniref:39 kDa protein n=1 Tax=Adoxophyes orana nucleopolyhedrovirus TaxID=542343 RepID=UPI0001829BDE|nr:39 kDa protein [Adoxophyes orana nucleopolyhedrovirus]ACF05305.1 39 kDa protein [Adoxophyes orana nucleopolyhedrovirus]